MGESRGDKVRIWTDVPLQCPRDGGGCHSGSSDRGPWKSSTSSESASRKLLDCWVWKSSALGVVPGDGTEVRMGNTYEQGESMRGEVR
jgi:hypothetical protein